MTETLTFDKIHYYNTLKSGITLTAILHHGQESVECEARLDTGSSHVSKTCSMQAIEDLRVCLKVSEIDGKHQLEMAQSRTSHKNV